MVREAREHGARCLTDLAAQRGAGVGVGIGPLEPRHVERRDARAQCADGHQRAHVRVVARTLYRLRLSVAAATAAAALLSRLGELPLRKGEELARTLQLGRLRAELLDELAALVDG